MWSLLLIPAASAASLDNLEIGGPWGSPTATDGTAVWWNPAGVAMGHGTRLEVEGAEELATVQYERTDPHGGSDTLKLSGVIPYVGLATDLGVPGLGLGLGLSVPIARGGTETDPPGAGSYHLIDGMNQAIYAQAALGYAWRDKVAVGFTGALVRSEWSARVNSDTLPDLDAAIAATGVDSGYTDALLEDPAYSAELDFDKLHDLAFAFSAGLQVRPDDRVTIGIAYVSGARMENEGDLTIQFQCPPDSDTFGRFGAEQYGICYATVPAHGSVSYTLPGRVQAGVAVTPIPGLRLEALGGWVGWSVFTDYDIVVSDAQAETEAAADLVNQTRQWARENHDSGWGGVDVKGDLEGGLVTLGARALYDVAAVPDEALSTNNYDANVLMTSVLIGLRPVKPLTIGVSYTHQFLQTRTVTDSGFGMTIEGDRNEDRWYYPQSNGTYSGTVDRIGVQARLAL